MTQITKFFKSTVFIKQYFLEKGQEIQFKKII